jgi:hypothetical protein
MFECNAGEMSRRASETTYGTALRGVKGRGGSTQDITDRSGRARSWPLSYSEEARDDHYYDDAANDAEDLHAALPLCSLHLEAPYLSSLRDRLSVFGRSKTNREIIETAGSGIT